MNTPVHRPDVIETTSLGAAYLAGLATGYWSGKDEILANWKLGRSFEPAMAEDVRNSKIKGWHRAVKCARIWAEDREN